MRNNKMTRIKVTGIKLKLSATKPLITDSTKPKT